MQDLMERQALLEIEMQGRGAARYRERTAKAIERDNAAATKPGTYLTKRVIEPLTKALDEWLAEVNTGRAGPRNRAALLIEGMDTDVVAYLTARIAISYSYASYNKLAAYTRAPSRSPRGS